ncbi:choice-of-anchor A family protein [Streptomyces sp. NPDC057697]|uniref:choice-of-anchor A family protein n=1 Tax=Streptomyces sp. NPDC057697 TaxID=3346219 RepID=UPI0036792FFD
MHVTGRTVGRTGTALAVLLSLGLLGTGSAFAAPAASDDGPKYCPSTGLPGIGHNPQFADGNVALFAGGDYTVDGSSAEAEGLLVVKGDATLAKDSGGIFNIGRVGAGSGILPDAGELMLAVGGNLTIAKGTKVDVGFGLTSSSGYGGAVQVGKKIDEKGELTTNGGKLASGLGAERALSPYQSFDSTIGEESASLGKLKPTGTTVRTGETVTFKSTGAGTGDLQVFEISAAELDGASSFTFESIPDGDSVVVNVTGSHAVSMAPMSVGFNNDRVDVYSSAHFGEAASRILYNFAGAPSLTLGGGGNFMGSILAPKASADFTASTNGRVYVGGDIRTHGTGNESHNYPWTGSPAFTCKPEPSKPGTPTPKPSQPEQPSQPPVVPGSPTPSASRPGTPAPTPTEAEESPQPVPTPSTPSSEPKDEGGFLASTGAQVGMYATGAAVLGVLGAGLLVFTRRRRGQSRG